MPMFPTRSPRVQNSPLPEVIPKNARALEFNLPASSVTPGCTLPRTTSARKTVRLGGNRWICRTRHSSTIAASAIPGAAMNLLGRRVSPFAANLSARVEAVMRRCAERPDAVGHLHLDGTSIHLARREVVRADGVRQLLSERETEILAYLAASRGRAIGRRELLQRVWGLDPRGIETRTVDMHVARLREKLGDSARTPSIVVTVRSKGYMLGDDVQVEC